MGECVNVCEGWLVVMHPLKVMIVGLILIILQYNIFYNVQFAKCFICVLYPQNNPMIGNYS